PLYRNRDVQAEERIHVTVYDNFARGVPEWLSQLDANERLTLVAHDVREPLPADVDDFDYIVHAAGIASPTYYRRYPIETMDANAGGLRALLDYARRRGDAGAPVEGRLSFSSSEIYAAPPASASPTPATDRGRAGGAATRALSMVADAAVGYYEIRGRGPPGEP